MDSFECRAPDGAVSTLEISGDGGTRLEFDDAGLLYITTGDNIHRLDSGTETALIGATGSPVQGALTIVADTFTDTGSASYAYNTRDQLIGVARSGGANESYNYDPAGNRSIDHHASDYIYNNLNQILSGNGIAYTYDADGNRIAKTDASGTTGYLYDAEHRLTRIDLPGGAYAEYAYDPFGRWIQKRIVDAQGGETVRRYVYDGEDILFELDGGDTLVTEFIHGPGIDEPLALRRGGQTYTYHADALGSIIAITDENGTVVQQYKYDAYGNITFTLNPSFEQPYGFTGREYDPESGLHFYRARYYDPGVGRFITRDPIGFNGGDVNLYTYVKNNPISWADPTGLDATVCLYSGAGGFGHVGVGVNSSSTVGFYPKDGAPGNPVSGTAGEVKPDTKDPQSCKTISTTPAQDKRMSNFIKGASTPPVVDYTLTSNNCVNFVRQVLNQAGIVSPDTIKPKPFFGGLPGTPTGGP